MFKQNSEFNPLKEGRSMQVSDAVQHCTLKVDEKGSVGASVTRFTIVALSIKGENFDNL